MIQLGCQMAALTVARRIAGQEDRCDMLLVVRHADAGDKGSWDGPDVGRPLSPAGCRQAEGLVVRLEDFPVERILCSPTVRCHQTVQPLADDRLLRIERVRRSGLTPLPPRCWRCSGIGGCGTWKHTFMPTEPRSTPNLSPGAQLSVTLRGRDAPAKPHRT